MARARYDVVYKTSTWHVTHEGDNQSTHAEKDPAVDAGVRAAIDNQPSQLFIHRMDGTIEDERTYGDDPYPPRG